MDLIDILIELLVGFRRGMLKQEQALNNAIERLNGIKKGDSVDMGVDPNTCEHKFVRGSCEKCGIFEEIAEKEAEDIE